MSSLDAGGPVTHQALDDGYVDVALLFTTDPAIDDRDLVELVDDRRLQPAENVTPLVRKEVVERWGSKLVGVIDSVSAQLTTDELRQLNARAAGGDVADVAAAWLEEHGLAMTTQERDRRRASEPHELAVPPTARRTRRRRRPTGAAPPLPRSIGTTGKGWLAVLVVVVVWIVVVGISAWARRVTDRVDAALLEQIARLRADWLTPIMRAIDRVGTGYIGSAIAMGSDRRAAGVPALASPVHVHRCHPRASGSSPRTSCTKCSPVPVRTT